MQHTQDQQTGIRWGPFAAGGAVLLLAAVAAAVLGQSWNRMWQRVDDQNSLWAAEALLSRHLLTAEELPRSWDDLLPTLEREPEILSGATLSDLRTRIDVDFVTIAQAAAATDPAETSWQFITTVRPRVRAAEIERVNLRITSVLLHRNSRSGPE